MAAYIVAAALLGEAHPVLDLGEGLLDRIEVVGSMAAGTRASRRHRILRRGGS